MNRYFLLGLSGGLLVAGVMAVSAAQPAQSIEGCGALLPAGYTFELSIDGTIDTHAEERIFRGNFQVSDGSRNSNPGMQEAAAPFVACVAALLK